MFFFLLIIVLIIRIIMNKITIGIIKLIKSNLTYSEVPPELPSIPNENIFSSNTPNPFSPIYSPPLSVIPKGRR